MGDLTALLKLVLLIEQIPSNDDTGAKILAEASIFRHFGTERRTTVVLDFLAKALEVLNCGKVTTSLGSWLVVHDGKKGEYKEGSIDGGEFDRGVFGSARGALVGCSRGSGIREGDRRIDGQSTGERVVGWWFMVGRDGCWSLCTGDILRVTLFLNAMQMMIIGFI